MNSLDIAFVVIIGIFLVRGLLRGMVSEIAAVGGVICGFFVAGKYAQVLEPHLISVVDLGALAGPAAYLVVFVAVMLLAGLLAAGLSALLDTAGIGWLSRIIGGVLGAGKGVLLCCIILAATMHFTPRADFLYGSVTAEHLQNVTVYLQQFLPDQTF